MSKKTLLFSNIIGDVMLDDKSVTFNDNMSKYLKDNLDSTYSMIFIDAPGLGGEDNYLPNIIRCFDKINIKFKNIMHVSSQTTKYDVNEFLSKNEKIIYFLMGGNPFTQFEIIKSLDMAETIKNYQGLVIGFCAGAINLSKYSIITSDEDFDKPDSYFGINRENICIEPHYNNTDDVKRNEELKDFSNKYNTNIYCIPDLSIIYFEDGIKTEKGKIYII